MKNICEKLAFQTSHRSIQTRNKPQVSNYCAIQTSKAQYLLKSGDPNLLGKEWNDSPEFNALTASTQNKH
jgi:hypothetical protein